MPLVQGFPTWKNMNSQNSVSSSGQTDNMTGQPYFGEGLYPGVYADMTNQEAANASNPTVGTLFNGRYRWVQVDSGATAANVATGTVGYIRAGSTVKSVVVLTQGSGQTVGTYNVAATGGGGSGAVIQVVVTSATAISVSVLNNGFGYTSVPTFTLATGGTPGTVAAQLDTTPNIVTSYDAAAVVLNVRPVVFLNSIAPGNYGFIQELGTATVLSGAATGTVGQFANVTNGVLAAGGTTYGTNTIGNLLDVQNSGALTKVILDTPVVQD